MLVAVVRFHPFLRQLEINHVSVGRDGDRSKHVTFATSANKLQASSQTGVGTPLPKLDPCSPPSYADLRCGHSWSLLHIAALHPMHKCARSLCGTVVLPVTARSP